MNKRLSLVQVVKRGFSVGLDNAHILVPTTLLFLCAIAAVAFAAAMSLVKGSAVVALLQTLKGASPELVQQSITNFLTEHPGIVSNGALALLLVMAITVWLSVGFARVLFDLFDTGTSQVSHLFAGSFKTACKFFVALLLLMIIVLPGFLLIVPGFYLAMRLLFAAYFILDKDTGIIESFKLSWRITKGQFWGVFSMTIIMSIVSGLIYLNPLALLLVSPLSGLIGIAFYRQLIQEGDADEQKQLQDATE